MDMIVRIVENSFKLVDFIPLSVCFRDIRV